MALEPSVATRLARLLRELDLDLAALQARAAETGSLLEQWQRTSSLSRPELVLLAVDLHGYYTALETMFERVARLLDDEVPVGGSWHSELIEQMQTDVPSLRPALVPAGSADDLHELRKSLLPQCVRLGSRSRCPGAASSHRPAPSGTRHLSR